MVSMDVKTLKDMNNHMAHESETSIRFKIECRFIQTLMIRDSIQCCEHVSVCWINLELCKYFFNFSKILSGVNLRILAIVVIIIITIIIINGLMSGLFNLSRRYPNVHLYHSHVGSRSACQNRQKLKDPKLTQSSIHRVWHVQ